MIFDKSILSRSYKLADADPIGTLDSCSRAQNEHKNIQNNLIEDEIRCRTLALNVLPYIYIINLRSDGG